MDRNPQPVCAILLGIEHDFVRTRRFVRGNGEGQHLGLWRNKWTRFLENPLGLLACTRPRIDVFRSKIREYWTLRPPMGFKRLVCLEHAQVIQVNNKAEWVSDWYFWVGSLA